MPEGYIQVVDNLSSGSMDSLGYLHSNPRFEFFLGNVEDIFLVEMLVADADYVINCINTTDPDKMLSTMVVGTQNILECLAPEQHYIHLSNGEYNYQYITLYDACDASASLIIQAYINEHNYHALVVSKDLLDSSLCKLILSTIRNQSVSCGI
jgi:dTDP-D-glucose 4,6-dehydratase